MFIALMPPLNLQKKLQKTKKFLFKDTIDSIEHEPYLETIKNKGLVIGSKILVWETSWVGPAYPHLTCCYYLENMQ